MFNIEKIVLEKYINELSGDAVKVLLKIIYLARTTKDDIHINNARMFRKIVGVNVIAAKIALKELIDSELIIEKKWQNEKMYTLNSKKIQQDNEMSTQQQFNNQLRNVTLTVFDNEQVVQEKQKKMSDDAIKQKIRQVFTSSDSFLIELLFQTVKLVQRHCIDRDKRFTFGTIARFLREISDFDKVIVIKACQTYSGNLNIAGQRGFRYIIRIAENKLKKLKDQPYIDQEVELRETEKRKQSSTRRFSIKLAIGSVLDNTVYKKLLTNNNVDELKRMWKIGADILRTKNREDELFCNYEWLNS
jgi:hypothetical protein